MTALVDIHLHLLPGIDDGPGTLDASLEHAARMAAAGVREAVVTPHVGHPQFDVAVRTDPEGNETRALFALTRLDGAEVLDTLVDAICDDLGYEGSKGLARYHALTAAAAFTLQHRDLFLKERS